MKKIRLLWHAKSTTGGYSQSISGVSSFLMFAWLGSPNKDGEVPVLSAFNSCREIFIAALWKVVLSDLPRSSYDNSIIFDENISIDKLLTPDLRVRVLVRTVSKISESENTFPTRAKRVLNIFERYLGWRRTRIYATEGKCTAKIAAEPAKVVRACDYVFDFSRKWVRSPELLSLYLMIVKLCQFDIWDDFKTVKDLQSVSNTAKCIKEQNITPYFTGTSRLWIPVLDNVNELFIEHDIKNNYKNYEGSYGFHVFVANQNPTSPVSKRWEKIRKKLQLKGITSDDL